MQSIDAFLQNYLFNSKKSSNFVPEMLVASIAYRCKTEGQAQVCAMGKLTLALLRSNSIFDKL